MFGLFTPNCPVDLGRKVWTEYRMRWLADRIGIDRLLKARVVTPTEEFFPGPFSGTESDVRNLMNRLAVIMGISLAPELEIADETEFVDSSGHYIPGSPARIQISAALLHAPLQVAATLIHELAHDILIGGGLIDPRESDHEEVTDLLLIYLGVGIIAANNTVVESTQRMGANGYWEIRRSGYLTAMEFGYALALFAYMRDEENPTWVRYLRHDAAEVMRNGLRFLRKTGDTSFHPTRMREKLRPPTVAEALDKLCEGSATERVLTLLQLARDPLGDLAVIDLIAINLADRQEAVAATAAAALEVLGDAATDKAPELLQALESDSPRVRAGAAAALGAIGLPSETLRQALIYMLRERNEQVLNTVAGALIRIGDPDQASVPELLRAIDGAVDRHMPLTTVSLLVCALMTIDPSPSQRIIEFYEDGNDEHRNLLLGLMREMIAPNPDEPGSPQSCKMGRLK